MTFVFKECDPTLNNRELTLFNVESHSSKTNWIMLYEYRSQS